MSLFNEPSAKLVESIKWFSQLDPETQELIRTTHIDNLLLSNIPGIQHIATLISEINKGLTTKSKEEVINRLKELGIDSTNASLMVNKILTQAPPYQLDLAKISGASEELFEKAVKAVIVGIFVNNEPDEELDKKFGKDMSVVYAVYRLIRGSVIFVYLRGEMTLEKIKDFLTNTYKINERKVDLILKYVQENEEAVRKRFLFSNTQDAHINIQRLIKNQESLILEVRELTAFLKQIYEQHDKSKQQPGVE